MLSTSAKKHSMLSSRNLDEFDLLKFILLRCKRMQLKGDCMGWPPRLLDSLGRAKRFKAHRSYRSKECCCQSLLPKKFTKGAAWIVADITTTWRCWVHLQIAVPQKTCTILLIDIGCHAKVIKTCKSYQQMNSLYLSLHTYTDICVYIYICIYVVY